MGKPWPPRARRTTHAASSQAPQQRSPWHTPHGLHQQWTQQSEQGSCGTYHSTHARVRACEPPFPPSPGPQSQTQVSDPADPWLRCRCRAPSRRCTCPVARADGLPRAPAKDAADAGAAQVEHAGEAAACGVHAAVVLAVQARQAAPARWSAHARRVNSAASLACWAEFCAGKSVRQHAARSAHHPQKHTAGSWKQPAATHSGRRACHRHRNAATLQRPGCGLRRSHRRVTS